MKIIKVVKKPEEVKEVKCPFCGCVLEYSDSDISFLREDLPSIACPNCENIITDIVTPSKEGRFKPEVWPDFYDYDNPNTKRLSDDEIRQYIDYCVKNTKQSKEVAYVATGDSFIMSFPDCDDSGEIEAISVIVAQGYKEGLVYEREGLY